ncbi:MAG TPA: carboxypeptidase regulatory-like domain-containing protein [Clostridiales bacterium]|nr:carboxypeptidase regulatory-like domain-containing protein [Clostridiales bacterium]HQP69028.1 carboxypeptidase regulatory-like domain-containing protein [Clostridiales bacterium]
MKKDIFEMNNRFKCSLLLVFIFMLTFEAFSQVKGKISGTVTDEKNNPIGGAEITIDVIKQITTSDKKGKYIFERLSPGSYTLSCYTKSYEKASVFDIVVYPEKTTALDFKLKNKDLNSSSNRTLPAEINKFSRFKAITFNGQIKGTVFNQFGTPIKDAKVYIRNFPKYTFLTDSTGEYKFTDIKTATCDLIAEYEDCSALELKDIKIKDKEPVVQDIVLKRKPILFKDIVCNVPYSTESFFYCKEYESVKSEIPYILKDENENFKQDWIKIDFYLKNKQPKSIDAKLDSILIKAEKAKSEIQILKALTYKSYAADELKIVNYNKNLRLIEKYLSGSSAPFKAVYNNLLFEMLNKYYRSNFSDINKRETAFMPDSVETWHNQDFFNKIFDHLNESLKNEEILKKTSPNIIEEILVNIVDYSRELRPSLYDFIVLRQIDNLKLNKLFWANKEKDNVRSQVNDKKFFGTNREFLNIELDSNLIRPLMLEGFNRIKEVTEYHLDDNDKSCLLDITLKRLKYAQSIYYNEDEDKSKKLSFVKDSLYLKAVQKLYDEYKFKDDYYCVLGMELAENYYNKKDYIKCNQICEEILNKDSKSDFFGLDRIKEIKHSITEKVFKVQTEPVILPNRLSSAVINHRNVDSLELKIFKFDKFVLRNDSIFSFKPEQAKLIQNEPVKRMRIKLGKYLDFKEHSTEIQIPSLEIGNYCLIFTPVTNLNDTIPKDIIITIQVTNLAVVTTGNNELDKIDAIVLNRDTGLPVKGIEALSFFCRELRFPSKYLVSKKILSDSKGLIVNSKVIRKGDKNPPYSETRLIVNEKGEYFDFVPNNEKLRNESQVENVGINLFTDREIYRPGQTVYYKGTAYKYEVKKNDYMLNDENSGYYKEEIFRSYDSLILNEAVKFELKDSNNKAILTDTLITDGFGSFSGSFVIPINLFKNAKIQVRFPEKDIRKKYNCEYYVADKEIKVEEYKLSNYEIKFLPDSLEYVTGDTIYCKGQLTAFAGFNVSNADVYYSYKHGYTGTPTEGNTKTDPEGIFEVKIPTSKTGDYSLSVKSTDLNGEVQTASINFPVYDYPAVLSVDFGNIYTSNANEGIFINKDDNDYNLKLKASKLQLTDKTKPDLVKLNGVVRIYKYADTGKLYRRRELIVPDTILNSNKEYSKNFPYDEYPLIKKEYGEPVLFDSIYFDTSQTDHYRFDFEYYDDGKYLLEFKSVKIQKPIKYNIVLFSDKKKKMPLTNQISLIYDKRIVNPGDKAVLYIGSSYRDVECYYMVEKETKIIDSKVIELNNELKKIEIPISDSLSGGINVYFTFVKNNRHYIQSLTIAVPWTEKKLDVKLSTFRDNTIPGSKEKWSVQVFDRDKKFEPVQLVLTAYDIALDKIAQLKWDFPKNADTTKGIGWSFYNFKNIISGVVDISTFLIFNPVKYIYYEKFNVWDNKDFMFAYPVFNKDCGAIQGKTFPNTKVYILESTIETVSDSKGNFYIPNLKEGKYKLKIGNGTAEIIVKSSFINRVYIYYSDKGYGRVAKDITTSARTVDMGNIEALAVTEVSDVLKGTSGIKSDSDGELHFRGGRAGEEFKINEQDQPDSDRNPVNKQPDISQIPVRSNFNETAFFLPDLRTDEKGNAGFEFIVPDRITGWRIRGFAHTKDLKTGYLDINFTSKKEVMIIPYAPRFFREGDSINFSAKITNISSNDLEGISKLELYDPLTNKPLDSAFYNLGNIKKITLKKENSILVNYSLIIPNNIDSVKYKIYAVTDTHSDGESKTIPVLKNRELVQESLPLYVNQLETKQYKFESILKKSDSSDPKDLILEFTQNPSWSILSALPYLLNFTYQCNEQIFTKMYANILGSYILNSNPIIMKTVTSWVQNDSHENKAVLLQNPDLKITPINQTPWVIKAEKDSLRKSNLGKLYEFNRLATGYKKELDKLINNQLSSGAWSWWGKDESRESRYITIYIVAGYAHMLKLGVLTSIDKNDDSRFEGRIKLAVKFLDKCFVNDYKKTEYPLNYQNLYYLYARTSLNDKADKMSDECLKAYEFYLKDLKMNWTRLNNYGKGLAALLIYRSGDKYKAEQILKSLEEYSISHKDKGVWWEKKYRWYLFDSEIETQAIMIEAFNEIRGKIKIVEDMKKYLLLNKRTNDWGNTKTTAEACFSLLNSGEKWLEETKGVEIKLGRYNSLKDPAIVKESGTGYFRKDFEKNEIKPEMSEIRVSNLNKVPAWGAIYYRYFNDIDKIEAYNTKELSIDKTVFREVQGKLIPIIEDKVQVGDILTVRLKITTTQDIEFVHLKDDRASCFEPVDVISGYKYANGCTYYYVTNDEATNFFFDKLATGDYQLEYKVKVTHGGKFTNGTAKIQCMYAPEFGGHSKGESIHVNELFGGVK